MVPVKIGTVSNDDNAIGIRNKGSFPVIRKQYGLLSPDRRSPSATSPETHAHLPPYRRTPVWAANSLIKPFGETTVSAQDRGD